MTFIRIACSSCLRRILTKDSTLFTQKYKALVCQGSYVNNVRYFSATATNYSQPDLVTVAAASQASALPNATSVVELAAKVIPVDPPFAEIGLGTGWWPYQLIERCLESLYLGLDMPWWVTIVVGTVILRVVTLPLFIASRKGIISFTNHLPEQQRLRDRMTTAFTSGTFEEKWKTRKQLNEFNKKNKTGPLRLMSNHFLQPFIFMSSMMALRQMAAVPLPSLEASEFFWISSLSGPDPYRLLPAITGVVLGVHIYATVKLSSTVPAIMAKYVLPMSIAPSIVFPLLMGTFSSTIGIYIATNSVITVAVTTLLHNESIKKKLNMPTPVKRDKKGSGVLKTMLRTNRDRSMRKMEASHIKKMLKEEKKARKKTLKGEPPVLYEIGKEATLKHDIPDFEKDWRPHKPVIYQ